MKKLFVLLLLLLTSFCVPTWAGLPDHNIVIIYTNDVHCSVDDNVGYAGLAFYKKEMMKKTPYVTLVDAGDAVQGAIIGDITKGRFIIDIMNAVGYDVAVPGNHEFYYGMKNFKTLAKNLSCGYVSCNFRSTVSDKLVFEPYKMISYGKTKVAFVGACTPGTISYVPPSFIDHDGNFIYDFDKDKTGKKIFASVQKAVNQARKQGADFVILVAHIGGHAKIWNSNYIVQNTRGIDAVIDGHSHDIVNASYVKNLDGIEIPVTQAGRNLKYIGQVTITTSGRVATKLIHSVNGRDKEITAYVQKLKKRCNDMLETYQGYTDFDLSAFTGKKDWLIRRSETNLSDFVADAYLAASEGMADIALVSAGEIRGNLKKGKINYNNALSILPFYTTLCICEVSGQVLLDELEMGARLLPEDNRGLLHVSGMSYTIDTAVSSPVQVDNKGRLKKISGSRRVRNVIINGKPIEPNKNYSVIGSKQILFRNTYGNRFEGARFIRPDFIPAYEALADYIRKFQVIPYTYHNAQKRLAVQDRT